MGKINEYLKNNFEKYADDVGVVYREKEEYLGITNKQIYGYVNSLVSYLKDKVNSPQNIAIIGGNKVEWLISFWATFGYVGNVLAIDKELNQDEILKIFDRVKPDLIIIDDDLPLTFKEYETLRFSDVSKIMKEEKEIVLQNQELTKHSGELFLHTSGTTGVQKIVKLTEDNLFGAIPELNERWEVNHKDSCLFIIPLYHIYALTTLFHSMYAGIKIILENDYKRMDQVLQITKPTLFMGVPLMYNKVKETVLSKNEKLIKSMIALSNCLLKIGIDIRKKLFKKVHDYFGGNYFFGCSAGSLLSYDTNKFFNDIGLPIYNVYGMTETAGPVAMNYKKNNDYNSVGKILNINNVKIKNADSEGIGEIWVEGNNVFQGYLGDELKEYMKDEYFNTGDIGYIKNDFLYVLGRKKNILIGDNGKNIAPEELIRKIVKYNGVNDCNIVMRDNKLHAIINSDLSQENIKNIIDGVNKKLPNYKKIFDFEITNKNIK